jgi:hypothetical protein
MITSSLRYLCHVASSLPYMIEPSVQDGPVGPSYRGCGRVLAGSRPHGRGRGMCGGKGDAGFLVCRNVDGTDGRRRSAVHSGDGEPQDQKVVASSGEESCRLTSQHQTQRSLAPTRQSMPKRGTRGSMAVMRETTWQRERRAVSQLNLRTAAESLPGDMCRIAA